MAYTPKPRKERPMVDVDLEPDLTLVPTPAPPKLYLPASWTADQVERFLAGRAR